MPRPASRSSHTAGEAPRIAVLGGGIAGLTAAYRLSKILPLAKVELLEASDRLGGMLHTQHHEQGLVEYGADSFLTKLPAALELCTELGLEDQIVPTNEKHRRALVLYRGKLHPVPTGFVQMRPEHYGPMLRTPLLSWRGKLRLLAEPLMPRSPQIHTENYDESVASFFTRRLGREAFERLVQPLLAGIYTADPYRLSVAATMPTALEAERTQGSLHGAVRAEQKKSKRGSPDQGARYSQFVSLKKGLSQLIDALVEALPPATLECPIRAVTSTPGQRWQVEPVSAAAPAPFDGVILALPAHASAQLLQACDPPLSGALESIPYADSAVAVLSYARSQIGNALDGFGVVVPTVAERPIVAASFSSVKFPGRQPEEQVLIRVFLGGALQAEILNQSDAELLQIAQSELQTLLQIQGDPLQTDLVRWTGKMPQYHVGHLQLVDQIEQHVRQHPGLELAGNAYRGVGIPQCVQSGNQAATRLAAHLTGA
jgi:oxygen-dependent protoporphyrinogen oxidase